MCGGAIISDFIPTKGSGRLTAGELWSGIPSEVTRQKGFSKPARSHVSTVFNDYVTFEADFLEFKDESDGEELEDVKPFAVKDPFSFNSSPGYTIIWRKESYEEERKELKIEEDGG